LRTPDLEYNTRFFILWLFQRNVASISKLSGGDAVSISLHLHKHSLSQHKT